MDQALRIWDEEWWSNLDWERIQQKLFLVLREELQYLAQFTREGKDVLDNPPNNWINWVLEIDYENRELLSEAACCACEQPSCSAWIAIHCGGCNRRFWYDQRNLRQLWCNSCSFNWSLGLNWVTALQNYTGLPDRQGLTLYESAEQLVIAYVRWHLQHWRKRIDAVRTSYLIAARCRSQVPLTQSSFLGPFTVDPNIALDSCLESLRRLNIRRFGSVKLKEKKRRRRRRKTEDAPEKK